MTEPEPVTPKQTVEKVNAGAALLICAYDNKERFRALHLEGAVSLSGLKSRLPALPKDQEIIFYCARHDEKSSAGQAAKTRVTGYANAKALKGGVEGWKQAGYRLA